jgi:hypothetical protein
MYADQVLMEITLPRTIDRSVDQTDFARGKTARHVS